MALNPRPSVVQAQSCLITDKDPRTIPTPPTLPSAGGTFVDPTFRQTIMRVTDSNDGGCSQSAPLYCPGDPITRAQMAAFLVRAFNL